MSLTPHQSCYFAWQLSRRTAGDSVEALASTLVDSEVDLNPHQIDAALFALRNPLSRGVILADEVGLGKTIEAGLVILQRWAERRRHVLIIVPANLRKQWHQELQDKFGLQGTVLETKNYNALRKIADGSPFARTDGPLICSYQFAKAKADDLRAVNWDLVVLDEAHRLRNVYKTSNVIAKALKDALSHVPSKVLLTATPLQNSLLELYGLVSVIDDQVFGDVDSFRLQFSGQARQDAFAQLRQRLGSVCKRTLRRQVQPYVSYTARRAIVQEFTPSGEEQELARLVREYLARPNLSALPSSQRQLISMVLWKLLASSSAAIAGALGTMAARLQAVLDTPGSPLPETLDDDYELLDEIEEEREEEKAPEEAIDRAVLVREVAELKHFQTLAAGIRNDAKGKALLIALERGFAELERLGAPQKAIIFTESKRTQTYLLKLLSATRYVGEDGSGIVLFNGTNSDAAAQRTYREWLARHAGTDRITGSKTADTRAALVEQFKTRGTLMIATEAGAEGINLQFCSLVINYDLPWNPQRIEQRIGRCHRYGQKFDVVVVNFVDLSNEADRRVYDLLAQKFQLFDGVFGASDEVLGAIGSGVDFERRIADIYATCRDPDSIRKGFEQLQLDLSGEISDAMVAARQVLLEHFDEEVQQRLRLSEQKGKTVRDQFEEMLLQLSQSELGEVARFDDHGFSLAAEPAGVSAPLGRYELPRRSGDAHLYRIGHPLAEWVIERAKHRELKPAHLEFDYEAYGKMRSTLKPLRGRRGWLGVQLLSVEAFDQRQERLLVAAITDEGEVLPESDPDKLLRLPARAHVPQALAPPASLLEELSARQRRELNELEDRNLKLFDQTVEKLDRWSDDLKTGLEFEIKDLDKAIKDARRQAAAAPTLQDKLEKQKQQRELEARRSRLRRELFERQDQLDAQRNSLIAELEAKVRQKSDVRTLFTVSWALV